jgi:hypothetical protein
MASLAEKAKKSTLITRFGGLFVYNAQQTEGGRIQAFEPAEQ